MLHPHGSSRADWRRHRALPQRESGKVHIVTCLVSSAFGLEPWQLYGVSRGVQRIAFARQVAMYIAHVWLGLSLSEVGRRFGRDRTTVRYACRVTEDRRDRAEIDAMLDVLETAASAWQDLADEQGRRA